MRKELWDGPTSKWVLRLGNVGGWLLLANSLHHHLLANGLHHHLLANGLHHHSLANGLHHHSLANGLHHHLLAGLQAHAQSLQASANHIEVNGLQAATDQVRAGAAWLGCLLVKLQQPPAPSPPPHTRNALLPQGVSVPLQHMPSDVSLRHATSDLEAQQQGGVALPAVASVPLGAQPAHMVLIPSTSVVALPAAAPLPLLQPPHQQEQGVPALPATAAIATSAPPQLIPLVPASAPLVPQQPQIPIPSAAPPFLPVMFDDVAADITEAHGLTHSEQMLGLSFSDPMDGGASGGASGNDALAMDLAASLGPGEGAHACMGVWDCASMLCMLCT